MLKIILCLNIICALNKKSCYRKHDEKSFIDLFMIKKSKTFIFENYYYVCLCAIVCNCSYQYICYLPVLTRDRANCEMGI